MNSQNPASTHFEVYTQDSSGRWNLHARYERNEREAALQDAKNVERTLQIPAKVIRDVYYPGNNQSEETLLYGGDARLRSKMEARAAATPSYRGRGGGGGGGAIRPPSGGPGLRPVASDSGRVSLGSAAKFLLVVVAALTLAGTATGLVNMALQPMSASITDTTQSLLLFMTFIVTFFSTALPLATSLLDFRLFGRRAKRTRPLPVPSAVPRPAAPAADVPEAIESEEEPDWEGLKDLDEALPPIEDQAAGATGESADAAAAPDPAGDSEAAPAGEAGYLQFIRFVNGLIAAVRRIRPTLDAYNLFGVDLVMAGAIDVLGQQQDMPADERRRVLKNAIEAMGVKAATAQAFADKYEDYLTESRYMPMIVAGRSTMESFLAGQDTLQDSIGPLFELWNRPQSQINPPSSRIMTVMFTDMVGSTDLTQAQGDRAAQTLVRRHNSIVRSALAEFSGKEIKHTGDGIMASFASAASGVEAAIAIQRAILRHNTQQPDQTLHIRIGINAGEPIEEEEDLFGTTVQLAARVCARCATDAILCSNVVKELASGRSLTFTSLGGQELKGFKDQITLYEVAWRE